MSSLLIAFDCLFTRLKSCLVFLLFFLLVLVFNIFNKYIIIIINIKNNFFSFGLFYIIFLVQTIIIVLFFGSDYLYIICSFRLSSCYFFVSTIFVLFFSFRLSHFVLFWLSLCFFVSAISVLFVCLDYHCVIFFIKNNTLLVGMKIIHC